MRLSRIKVKNYRSFLEADLELRPLTLIYGENNSGKSALLRLLPILGYAVGKLEGAVWPSGIHAMRGGGAASLISTLRGAVPGLSQALELTLVFDGCEATWTFMEPHDRTGLVQVRRLEVRWGEELRVFELREDLEPSEAGAPYFRGDDLDDVVTILWRGPYPESEEELGLPRGWLDALKKLGGAVQWIDSTRQRVGRRYTTPQQRFKRIEPSGEDAPLALWADATLLEQVNAWYMKTFERRLELNSIPSVADEFTLDVVAEVIGSRPLSLADGGEGLGQALPIITALAMARSQGASGRIVALEEPETHLHPTHHEALLDEIVAAVSSENRPTVVVETHSYELLLATMLAVAQGRLSAQDVVVHYAYKDTTPHAAAAPVMGLSALRSATFDAKGRPQESALPRDIFMSDTALASRLFAAQRGA